MSSLLGRPLGVGNAQRETEGHLKDIEETILQNLAKMNATKRKSFFRCFELASTHLLFIVNKGLLVSFESNKHRYFAKIDG